MTPIGRRISVPDTTTVPTDVLGVLSRAVEIDEISNLPRQMQSDIPALDQERCHARLVVGVGEQIADALPYPIPHVRSAFEQRVQ